MYRYTMKQIHAVISSLNKSKIFAGIVMILLNIASKHVHIKLTPSQELYLKKYLSRELFIFATCWLGTRDIYISLGVSILFFIMTTYIFHEDSPIGIIQKHDPDEPINKEEVDRAWSILKRAKEQEDKTNQDVYYYYMFKQ